MRGGKGRISRIRIRIMSSWEGISNFLFLFVQVYKITKMHWNNNGIDKI